MVHRRRFLRATAVGLAAATAGCSVQFGDFEINVGERDDTTPTEPPTEPATGTAPEATEASPPGTTTETAPDTTTETTSDSSTESPTETPTKSPTDTPTATESDDESTSTPTDDGGTSVSALSEGDLVITEVMIDPEATSDSTSEWFELSVAHPDPVDLDGLVLRDSGTDSHTVSGLGEVPSGAHVTFAASHDGANAAGFSADYAYGGLAFGNTGDDLIVTNGSDVIDQVAWDDAPTGRSWSLDPAARDAVANDDSSNWCAAETQLGGGDYGTPGEPNTDCS